MHEVCQPVNQMLYRCLLQQQGVMHPSYNMCRSRIFFPRGGGGSDSYLSLPGGGQGVFLAYFDPRPPPPLDLRMYNFIQI